MQIERSQTSANVAKIFGWALLVTSALVLAVVISFAVDIYLDPQSSYAYQVVSSFLSAEEPLVSVSEDGKVSEISIGPQGRLMIAILFGFFALSVSVSFFSALISSAISLLNFAKKDEDAT